ncbi:MAG: Rieske 2Fe-2S domain-containing protein [Chloroflexi bacterium]|nr:Rieske 2Fe-2S domain-containing protein [Chloroflexota bacterium]
MALVSLAFAVGQFWILTQNFLRRSRDELPIQEVARLDEVPVGGSLIFNYPQEHNPCLLVRLDEQTFVAYDQLCTHLSCPVIPQAEAGHLHCPCHEGSFDLRSGQPVAGPPRRPLPRIKLDIRGDKIYATGVEETLA